MDNENADSLNDVQKNLLDGFLDRHVHGKDKIKVQITGFYYTKYSEYSIGFRVNGSHGTINLEYINLRFPGDEAETKPLKTEAVAELDRMIHSHYEMIEALEALIGKCRPGWQEVNVSEETISKALKALSNARGEK